MYQLNAKAENVPRRTLRVKLLVVAEHARPFWRPLNAHLLHTTAGEQTQPI